MQNRESAMPDWWDKAVELEHAGKLEEAEDAIRKGMTPGDPWDCQTAYLYELRTKRLLSQGNIDEARKSFKRGCDLMRSYASGATSGGEGVALSAEADEYEAELRKLIESAARQK
jgi:hypothetical protein